MGHVSVDALIRGARRPIKLEGILIDTGATYTVLPTETVDEAGAIKTPYTVGLELGDGRKIVADIFVASVEIEGREAPAIIASFKDAKPVVGVQALESLGLRVDPTTGKLEPVRPKGVAYFY